MSDDSSSESLPKAKKTVPVVAAKTIEDSDSDSEAPPKKVAAAKKAVAADDSSSEEAAPSKATKAKADAKPVVESDSDSEDVPARPVKAAAAESDDSDDGEAAASPKEESKAKSSDKDAAKSEKKEKKPKVDRASDPNAEVEEDRVFVAGLPFTVDAKALRKDFGECGPIEFAKVLLKDNNQSKGMAFIKFKSAAGAKKALELDGNTKLYKGKTLSVKAAVKKTKEDEEKTKKDREKRREERQKALKEAKDQDLAPGKLSRKAQKLIGEAKAILNDVSSGDIISPKMLNKLAAAQRNDDFASLQIFGTQIATRAKERLELVASRKAKAAKKKETLSKQEQERKHRVIVKGMPQKDFGEEQFRQRFQDCGHIKFLYLKTRSNGTSKGWGMICFASDEAVEKALKYDGTKCKGDGDHVLSVQRSLPQENGDGDKKEKENGKKKKDKRKAPEEAAEEKVEKKKRKTEPEEAAEEAPKKDKSEKKAKKEKKTEVEADDDDDAAARKKAKKEKKEKKDAE